MLFSFISRASLVLLIVSNFSLSAQQKQTFGKLSKSEKSLEIYEKDPSANAVVLYEHGDNYFEVIDRRIRLVKEYHTKVKILNEKGFDHGTITIALYKNGTSVEKIKKLQAVTHLRGNQYNVLPSEIFTKDLSEYRSEKSFTFPKLQKGSILEYSYKIISPFVYNFQGWSFQSDIPKIYSEFNAKIPGNYQYNRALIGSLELAVNDAKVQKECFHIDGIAQSADCEVLKYAMKDIPAFKAEKAFMLSENNYISRLDFELSQYKRLDGTTDKYTKTWEDVDQEFRGDKDVGRQLTKNGFFEKHVPASLLKTGDALTKAKNIYTFVKNHYTWNGKYGIYGKARVKEAFEERKGSTSEVNMSLINLLNAANIKTNLMLLSTREKGLPKQTHPIMSDFNYSIAKVEIDGQNYLLDATDKYLPFGMLPYRALNHYGRVMDFENESYWHNIEPYGKNKYQVRAHLKFNVAEAKATGILDVLTLGYDAVKTNEALEKYNNEEYLDRMESGASDNFRIVSHELSKERSSDSKVSERFTFEVENMLHGDMVYFNPFFFTFFDENPFLLDERNYPVDFGYPRNYKYQLAMTLPEGYTLQELPKEQRVKIGDTMATLAFHHQTNGNQIGIFFDLSLNRSYFEASDYEALKNIFKHVTDIQKNTLIALKRTLENGK